MKIYLCVLISFLFSFASANKLTKLKDVCSLTKKSGCGDLESAQCELLGYQDYSAKALYFVEGTNFDFIEVYNGDKGEMCNKITVTSECRILGGECDEEVKTQVLKPQKKRQKK